MSTAGALFVIRCRRGEADEIEPGLDGGQAQFVVLFRRQIDDDQPVDAGEPWRPSGNVSTP